MGQNGKWSSAAANGLILSLVTIIYTLSGPVLELKGIIMIILWIIKFTACIYLLYYFMKQYSGKFDTISYGESFNYGFILCVFSSLICAGFSFLSVTFIFPEQFQGAMEQLQQSLAAQNQEGNLDKAMSWIPEITLFGSLIYYIIFGAVTSAIIANYTKKTDIFAGEQPAE